MSTLVCFGDDYAVLVGIHENFSAKDFAEVLKAILPRHPKKLLTSELAADFIAAIHPAVRPQVYSYLESDAYNLRIYVSIQFGKLKVKVVEKGQTGFAGDVASFYAWCNVEAGLAGLLHKVVQFTYRGGSSHGPRTVRVEKSGLDNGHRYIEGYDLSKIGDHSLANVQDANCYRRYTLDKIDGGLPGVKIIL